jgi:hypothetical protein
MRSLLQVALVVAAIAMSSPARATEPPCCSQYAWVTVTISSLFIGDYNQPNGWALIGGTDGQFYYWDMGTPFAKAMYATALGAKLQARQVQVLRSNTLTPNAGYLTYRVQVP